jgi:putative hemolysin
LTLKRQPRIIRHMSHVCSAAIAMLLVMASALPGSSAAEPSLPSSAREVIEAAAKRSEAKCKARGGTLQRSGMQNSLGCIVRFADGGKPCTDSAQCRGECLATGPSRNPFWPWDKPVRGVCAVDDNIFGCKGVIRGGKVMEYICVD